MHQTEYPMRVLFGFPRAIVAKITMNVVTEKKCKLIFFHFQRSEVQNVCLRLVPPEAPGEHWLLPFPGSRSAVSLAHSPSLHPHSQQSSISHLSAFDAPSPYRGPVSGALIPPAESLLPCDMSPWSQD